MVLNPLRRRLRGSDDEVVLWRDDSGIIVGGSDAAVVAFVGGLGIEPWTDRTADGLTLPSGSGSAVAKAGAALATLLSTDVETTEYLQLTDRSKALIAEHGALPNGNGGFRAFVHDGKRIAGQLEYESVMVSPDRALAVQSAAVGIALQAAVRQVEIAVERVEHKVERILGLMRAERIGDVLGDKVTLDHHARHLDAGHQLAATDWQAIAPMEKDINRDLLALRKHILFMTEEIEASWRPRSNADMLEELSDDGLLAESLALLTVAEYNAATYQRLRLANIEANEPHQLAAAVTSAHALVAFHNEADQQLLDHLRSTIAILLKPNQLDPISPFQTKQLERERQKSDAMLNWFGDQRSLVYEPLTPASRTTLGELANKLMATTRVGISATTDRLPGRSSAPELEPGTDRPTLGEPTPGD